MRQNLSNSNSWLRGLVVVFLFAAVANCHAQKYAYSVDGKSYEHEWYIEFPLKTAFGQSHRFGLQQYSQSKDTNGHIVINLGPGKAPQAVNHVYTEILFGTHSWTLEMPAVLIAVIAAVLGLFVGWFAMVGFGWIGARRTGKRMKPPPEDAAKTRVNRIS